MDHHALILYIAVVGINPYTKFQVATILTTNLDPSLTGSQMYRCILYAPAFLMPGT